MRLLQKAEGHTAVMALSPHCLFPLFYVFFPAQSSYARSTQCMLEPWGKVHQLSAKAKKQKHNNNEAAGRRLTYNTADRKKLHSSNIFCLGCTKEADKHTVSKSACCIQHEHQSTLYTGNTVVHTAGRKQLNSVNAEELHYSASSCVGSYLLLSFLKFQMFLISINNINA